MRRNIDPVEARLNVQREMEHRGRTWGERSYESLKIAEAKSEFDAFMARHNDAHMSKAQRQGGKAKHLNRGKRNG